MAGGEVAPAGPDVPGDGVFLGVIGQQNREWGDAAVFQAGTVVDWEDLASQTEFAWTTKSTS